MSREQLELAQTSSNGRSASTVYGGHEHVLRQTMIALVGGQRLSEHENPGEATVHVLHGRVRLGAGENRGTARPVTSSSCRTAGTISKRWRTPSSCSPSRSAVTAPMGPPLVQTADCSVECAGSPVPPTVLWLLDVDGVLNAVARRPDRSVWQDWQHGTAPPTASGGRSRSRRASCAPCGRCTSGSSPRSAG
jgi:hypothetical protein